tara:strand:+ start:321 stop:1040 length:720 start_codon:yes stop_codon:yes gene_type:complete
MDLDKRKLIVFGSSSDIAIEFINNQNEFNNIYAVSRDKTEYSKEVTFIETSDYKNIDEVFELIDVENNDLYIVNFVGSINLRPIHLAKDDEMYEILEVNLMSNFRILSRLLKKSINSLSYVCFSSVAASYGLANHELIASAKSGLEGLIRSCSATYGYKGYRFNCIAPALIETKLSSKFVSNDKAKSMVSNMNVLNKIGQPSDITKCLSWLLSDESDFVTGQTINIDGGMNNINTRIVR